jgi:hypothetical protein
MKVEGRLFEKRKVTRRKEEGTRKGNSGWT